MEIGPGLFLGSIHAAFNLEGLKDTKIMHIVNLAGSYATFPQDFVYLCLSIRDKDHSNLLSCLPLALLFIDYGTRAGGVLIHCAGGRSRSPALVIAYLMSRRNMSFTEALDVVRAARPVISVNQGFEAQLRCLEQASGDVFLAHQLLLQSRLFHFAQQYADGSLVLQMTAQQKKKTSTRIAPNASRAALTRSWSMSCDERGMLHGQTPCGFSLSLPSMNTSTTDFIPALRSMGTMFGCRCCGANLFCSSAVICHTASSVVNTETAQLLERSAADGAQRIRPIKGDCPFDEEVSTTLEEATVEDASETSPEVAPRAQPMASTRKAPLLAKLRIRPRSADVASSSNSSNSSKSRGGVASTGASPSASQSHGKIRRSVKQDTDASTRCRECGDQSSAISESFWKALVNSLRPFRRSMRDATLSKGRDGKASLQGSPQVVQEDASLEGSDATYRDFLQENKAAWEQQIRRIQRSNSVDHEPQVFLSQVEALLAADARAMDALECETWFVEPPTWLVMQAMDSEAGKITCPNAECGSIVGEWQWSGLRCHCGGALAPAFLIDRAAIKSLGLLVTHPNDEERDGDGDDGSDCPRTPRGRQ